MTGIDVFLGIKSIINLGLDEVDHPKLSPSNLPMKEQQVQSLLLAGEFPNPEEQRSIQAVNPSGDLLLEYPPFKSNRGNMQLVT